MRVCLTLFFLICFAGKVLPQDSLRFFFPSPKPVEQRVMLVVGAQAVGYGGSLVLLSDAWYRNYDQTSFHFFDDGREWLQLDKAGHITASWYFGRIGIDMMEWSGVGKKQAIWYGTAGSFLYLTGIEILDGFSDGWGFSWSDFSANTFGTGLIISQRFLQHSGCNASLKKGAEGISLKFSFRETNYPQYHSSLLGNTLTENILKDYNGQSYWISFNISSFLKIKSKFPAWLNLAVGYGGEGMISSKPGFVYMDSQGNTIAFERHRQYYFSFDMDLTKIKTQSRFLKTVFETVSFIKIPAPALELSKHGLKFHSVYY